MSAWHGAPPWGTIIVFAGSASVFLFTGPAPGYVRQQANGAYAFPDVEVFALDAFRHPGVLVLLATLLVGVPISVSVERVAGGVGVAAVYVVAGFGSGFAEAARMAAPVVPVAGAFGGTTALLTMWLVLKYRSGLGFVAACSLAAGWLGAAMLQTGPFPLLACAIAGCAGLYATDATVANRRTDESARRAA